jgi:hypothetical protein
MLTVLTVFSVLVLTLIILVPIRPSREKEISIPSVRRNVCARRSRPASARGFFAQSVPLASRARSAHKRRRSEAAPGPHGLVDHHGAHARGYGICFDDALDCGSAVCRVGPSEGAGRPQRWLASGGPEREICHPRQLIEVDTAECAQPMRKRVEQGAENAGPLDPELAPKFCLGAPVRFCNRG